MGLGDVKLVAMLAAWLGLRQTGLVLFLAVVAGAAHGLGMILVKYRAAYNRKSAGASRWGSCRFPLGPC